MPTIPKSIVTGTAKPPEDPDDPIESDFTPPIPSLPDVDSTPPLNGYIDIPREPIKLSLKSSKPTTNILSSLRAAQTFIPSNGALLHRSSIPSPFGSVGVSKPLPSTLIPHPGFYNMGHTCYVNSCTQAILFAPAFRDSLARLATDLNSLIYSSPQQQFDTFDSYSRFIQAMATLSAEIQTKSHETKPGTAPSSIRPQSYLRSLAAIDNRYGAGSEQQDVQEFFVFLLSALDDGATMMKEKLSKGELVLEDSMDTSIADHLLSGKVETQQQPTSDTMVDLNEKKRRRDQSDLPSAEIPLEASSESTISIPIGNGAHNPKRAKLEEASSQVSSEPSDSGVNTSIIPNSQELAGELLLSYESQSLEDNFQTINNMAVDVVSATSISIENGSSVVGGLVGEGESANGDPVGHKEEKIRPTISNSALPLPHEIFQGELTSTFQCMECERESGRPEAFYDISLPIEKGNDLPTLLSRYFSKSTLNGREKYDCDACRHMNEAFHYQRISKLPNVLTIHLKRFSWSAGSAGSLPSGYALRSSYASTGAGKLNFHITCPFNLQISRSWLTTKLQKEFLLSSISSSSSEPIDSSKMDITPTEPVEQLRESEELRISKNMLISSQNTPLAHYQLLAVIFHTGSSTTFGHYTVAIRLPHLGPSDPTLPPQWALFDDDHVSPVSHDWVMLAASEKAVTSSTAYILLYDRILIPS